MKRSPLFILLILMSLRLVASVAGVAFQPGELPGKNAHYTTQHGATESYWLLAESEPAEETEEDSTEGFHPAELPALIAWAFASGLTDPHSSLTDGATGTRPAQPLFVLFQNFRI